FDFRTNTGAGSKKEVGDDRLFSPLSQSKILAVLINERNIRYSMIHRIAMYYIDIAENRQWIRRLLAGCNYNDQCKHQPGRHLSIKCCSKGKFGRHYSTLGE